MTVFDDGIFLGLFFAGDFYSLGVGIPKVLSAAFLFLSFSEFGLSDPESCFLDSIGPKVRSPKVRTR